MQIRWLRMSNGFRFPWKAQFLAAVSHDWAIICLGYNRAYNRLQLACAEHFAQGRIISSPKMLHKCATIWFTVLNSVFVYVVIFRRWILMFVSSISYFGHISSTQCHSIEIILQSLQTPHRSSLFRSMWWPFIVVTLALVKFLYGFYDDWSTPFTWIFQITGKNSVKKD